MRWTRLLATVSGLCVLSFAARGQVVVFSENFEGGGVGAYAETDAAGVPTATLWHGEGSCDVLVPIPASMGFFAAAYNLGDTGVYDYATGGANAGAIESPVIPSAPDATLTLTFDYAKETEGGGTGSFDQCFVEAKSEGAGAYGLVGQVLGNAPCPSQPTTFSTFVCGVPGGPWRHRFRFDSVDGTSNAYRGWTVDNVVATQNPAAPGSFTILSTGCGGPPFSTLTPSGEPVLGGTVTLTMGDPTNSFLWVGNPMGFPLCPPNSCRLSAFPGVTFVGPDLTMQVPCDTTLLGSMGWAQGGNLFAPGGCSASPLGFSFTLTNAVQVVIG
ncbi:MAG TPA: hypothetical protein VFI25_17240 [Planctomycetota bacterium]|jgi:hypothetical protein|nr:hypothetical protein [Planctomycetota bacterium]